MNNTLYNKQLNKTELNIHDTWKNTDIRLKFQEMFEPITLETYYYFRINETDKSAKILELYRSGNGKRIMGFSARKDMQINAFLNADFYNEINAIINLPENKFPNKSQPHITTNLEGIWNILCVATGNNEFLV